MNESQIPKKYANLFTRGVDEIIDPKHLLERLESGKTLRVKLGIDPTSPNLHLGRSVPLLKLRDFQELGHQVVFIVGDFTGTIGDTSDKDAERPMLTDEQVVKNLEGYLDQVSTIIDIEKAEVHHNSEWLSELTYKDIGYHANMFSVNSFISRDNIKRRLEAGKRVSLRELLYPLMQGYDSVKITSDVELGGTDQRFNILAGRHMQEAFGQEPQDIILNPLFEGLDGRKMSSSWGNTINFKDEPADMYGKVMSVNDELIVKYFMAMTRIPLEDVYQYEQQLKDGENPKVIKQALARELVSMYHDSKQATEAEASWEKAFSEGDIPPNTPVKKVKIKMPLVDILIKEGLVSSKSEFRRLVEQGAIKMKVSGHERKVVDPQSLAEESGALKIGKKRFLKIEVKKDAPEESNE